MLALEGVAKYFGRFSALRELDLRVEPGDFVALFGRNGAGKTTLLRIAAGLSNPSRGRVTLDGPPATSPRQARGRIGYLAHATVLYGDLTALENLRFHARLFDLPAGDAELTERIARVGLAGREHEPVRNYSRGMQQRLAILRAFLHDPELLLLDEPFTGLDREGSEFLKGFLRSEQARGKTALMAIHDLPLGYELGTRLVAIDRGGVALDVARDALAFETFQERYDGLRPSHAR
jgi:heme ABC exporter ATP-binding subunit CcmA